MDVKNAIRTQFEQSEVWDQVSFADKVRAEVSAALVPVDVRSILDLGCGDGRITNLLARQDRFVVGTDISKTALQRVNAYRVLASIDSLPFHSLSFDLVTAFEVLEHLPDDMLRKVLCEIKRVTRRYVIVSVLVVSPAGQQWLSARVADIPTTVTGTCSPSIHAGCTVYCVQNFV
jgi:2-polyprenyl-3-methyl-5-hydroxy-6-metoxy-1,4-benzoquinol methylase